MFFRLWKEPVSLLFRRPFPAQTSILGISNKSSMSTQVFSEEWLVGPQSTNFYTRTYTPASPAPTKAAVVFVHGFAEHIARFTHFHPQLTARGLAIFTYDQRGFGLTAQDKSGKKSKSSTYGKTSWKEQMDDIEWAIGHAKKTFEGVPLFLMGHSMGGGEVLGFATQGKTDSQLKSLTGVIATSPLIAQTTPAPGIAKWVGGKLSLIAPSLLIPAAVKAEDLSHDPAVGEAYFKDPLVKQSGSLKGVHDMLTQGEILLKTGHAHWPKDLPLLIVHGTEDKATSHVASQTFHDKVPASKKKITLFPGGYHELHNEPDGVQEKLANELVAFIEEHLTSTSVESEATGTEAEVGASTESAKAKM